MIRWLDSLDMAIDSFLNFEEILQRVVESLKDSSGFETVVLGLFDPASETLKVKSHVGISASVANTLKENAVPFTQLAKFMRRELKVGDSYLVSPEVLDRMERNAPISEVDITTLGTAWRNQDIIMIPVDSEDGRFLGALFLSKPLNMNVLDLTKIRFFESFASSIGRVIENISLYDNAKSAVKRLSTLYDVTTALSSILTLDQLFKEIVQIVRKKLEYKTVGILLLDEDRRYLRVKQGVGYTALDLRSVKIDVNTEGVTGLAVKEERPILVADVREEPRYIGERRSKSELAVPLLTKDGVKGVLDVESDGAGSLSGEDVKLLTSLATFIATAIDNAELYEKTIKMAITDELTGAYNYRYLKDRLAEELKKAREGKSKLSLLMLDLDNFKEINDSRGHSEGDEVLRSLGQKLRTGLRKDDVFTRYGGDEFMVILPETDKQEAIKIAHRLKRIVEENRLRTSIGVATYPDDSQHLIEAADKALYRAKEKGKDLVFSF